MPAIATSAAPRAPAHPDDPIAAYRRAVRKRLLLGAALALAIAASLLADIGSGPASLTPGELLGTL
ncbi:MAG: iron ABC transporter permease, partial [Achromobacter veterisilvae]